jgi:hypothetical protein
VPRKSGRLGDMAGSVMEYVIARTVWNLGRECRRSGGTQEGIGNSLIVLSSALLVKMHRITSH